MAHRNAELWNLLSAQELAMLFAEGMKPSELPVHFARRRERVLAALTLLHEPDGKEPEEPPLPAMLAPAA